MADAGVQTTQMTLASNVDGLIGNKDGSTVRIPFDTLAARVWASMGPTYETQAGINGDLNWPDGSLGTVWGDADGEVNGIYKKSGSSGNGSWSRITDLAMNQLVAAAADSALAALISEGNSATSETNAAISASTATSEAESAITAALAAGAAIYADTATGIAATSNGDMFFAPVEGIVTVYKNQSGVAVEVAAWRAHEFATAQDLIDNSSMTYGLFPVGTYLRAGGFRYVVALTAVADHHIITAGGVKMYVVPSDGVYNVEAWGTVTAATFNAAAGQVADIARSFSDPQAQANTVLKCSSRLSTDTQLVIQLPNGNRAKGLDIDLNLMHITALSGGSLAPTEPVLYIKARSCKIHLGYIDCNRVSSGAHMEDCQGAGIWVNATRRYPTPGDTVFGVKIDGDTSGIHVYQAWSIQWDVGDPEYSTLSNFTARTYWFDGIDFEVHNIHGGWSGVPIYIGPASSFIFFHGIHPYNGNTATVRTDPVLIENHSTGPVIIQGSYLDNGLTHDYSAKLIVIDNIKLELSSNVTLNDPMMRVYCTAEFDGLAPNYSKLSNNTGLSVGYFSDPTDTYHWAGDNAAIADFYEEMNQPSVITTVAQRHVDIYCREDTLPIRQSVRMGGYLAEAYHSVLAGVLYNMNVQYDPIEDEVRFSTGALRVQGWGLAGAGSETELTLAAGGITPNTRFHVVDTEGDAATDDLVHISIVGIQDGSMLTLCPAANNRAVVVKHAIGNIFCGSDRVLNNTADTITLVKAGSFWRMVSYADNL